MNNIILYDLTDNTYQTIVWVSGGYNYISSTFGRVPRYLPAHR